MANKSCRQLGQEILSSTTLPLEDWRVVSAELLNRSLTEWVSTLDLPLSPDEEGQLRCGIERYLAGEPLAYITGRADFYGRTFTVTPSVLIPRPETELIMERILNTWPPEENLMVVDLGTGSGCLAITLALERPNWQLHAVDLSAQALEVAKANAKRWQVQVEFHQGSWLEPMRDYPLDAVVSNPPYISQEEVNVMDPSVLDHEPHLALFAKEGGLACYRDIFDQLKDQATWRYGILECGFRQGERLKALAQELLPLVRTQIGRDYQQLDRWIELKR